MQVRYVNFAVTSNTIKTSVSELVVQCRAKAECIGGVITLVFSCFRLRCFGHKTKLLRHVSLCVSPRFVFRYCLQSCLDDTCFAGANMVIMMKSLMHAEGLRLSRNGTEGDPESLLLKWARTATIEGRR